MTFAVHAIEARGEIPRGEFWEGAVPFSYRSTARALFACSAGHRYQGQRQETGAKILQNEPPVFLRTLDGIHIATALALDCLELITADKKMADTVTMLGI